MTHQFRVIPGGLNQQEKALPAHSETEAEHAAVAAAQIRE